MSGRHELQQEEEEEEEMNGMPGHVTLLLAVLAFMSANGSRRRPFIALRCCYCWCCFVKLFCGEGCLAHGWK